MTVTWKKMEDKTLVTLTSDTNFTDDNYETSRIEGDSPRELLKIFGAARGYKKSKLTINSPEIKQARFGIHAGDKGKEIHIVFDLTASTVKIGEVEATGKRLTIEFQNLQ
jgi:hypothetical protein